MQLDLPQILFLAATLLATFGLIIIIYSRDNENITSKLFILMLLLSIAYLISHSIHFLFMHNTEVTVLDLSCHSLLLLMVVTLTFFTWNFPNSRKIGITRTLFIIIPTVLLLIMLWSGNLIIASHAEMNLYKAHYSEYYPLYLLWYIILISLNIYWLLKKYSKEKITTLKSQILLFLVGLVITNILLFMFGFLLPWIVGFYFLIEMSPLAFLVGLILFTSVAVGKFNMFPAALDRVRTFSINKKIFLSAIILVPIIILLIEIPLVRIFFQIKSNDELIKYFYVTFFGGLIVSISMAFVLQKIISSPLIKLKTRAMEIGQGNYGIKVAYNSNDEIGELTEAFNNMSETLSSNYIELKKREERISFLLNAFDKSSVAIAIIDSSFNIIEVNDTYCSLVKLGKEKIINHSIKAVQFSHYQDEFHKIENDIIQKKQFKGEIIRSFDDSEEKHLLLSVTPAVLDEGSSKGFLFVEVDITDRKKLEEQLRKSEKLAALGEMAAVLAHEIKTPLTSIKMNSDILVETLNLNEDDQFAFTIIQKEINRLNNLVKDVLQFSRQIDLVCSKFSLKNLVEDIKSQIGSVPGQKDITITNNLNNIEIEADYEKLKQVFFNLIYNSIEAINKQGTIELTSDYLEEKNQYIITLKDNGTGIKNTEKIFEPFFTTKASGTGLGLSISQKIIEQHTGRIKLISSKPGETIFEITLPV